MRAPSFHLCLFLVLSGPAPSQPVSRAKFDVASVKLIAGDCGGSMSRTNTGLHAYSGLERLLEFAYQTKQLDLTRVPAVLRRQCFDIEAKSAQKITGDQHWEMLQDLLEDRFRLAYHRETKEAQVYVLVPAKPGAMLGPKIAESPDHNCPADVRAGSCGVAAMGSALSGQRVPMNRIARELSVFAGRPVLDRTGLTGRYDFQLSWTPDQGLSEKDRLAEEKLKAAPRAAIDQSGASFFTVIEEQLGLKLQPQKGQLEILVVDRIDHPSGN
jgi:uncharacterized protein (TIGR03435 family)